MGLGSEVTVNEKMEDKPEETNFEMVFRVDGNKITFQVINTDSKAKPVSPEDYIVALYGEIIRAADMCDIPVHQAIAMAHSLFNARSKMEAKLVNERPPTDSRH